MPRQLKSVAEGGRRTYPSCSFELVRSATSSAAPDASSVSLACGVTTAGVSMLPISVSSESVRWLVSGGVAISVSSSSDCSVIETPESTGAALGAAPD